MFKPEDWEDYELETMHGTWWNKAYYGFYKSVDNEGHLIIDMLNGAITTGVGYHYAGHVALMDGTFRTIVNSEITAPSVLYISIWDNDDASYRMYSYKSPMYVLEKPANFKVAQIIMDKEFYEAVLALVARESTLTTLNTAEWTADPYERIKAPFNDYMFNEQDFNGDSLYTLGNLGIQAHVNFTVWADGEIKFTKQVIDSNMFKLPRGFRDKKWEFGVDGMIPVKRITVATSTEEIV